jgi:4-amino-4-deoxy-L-arabinose transferase-like glycosyltransferase
VSYKKINLNIYIIGAIYIVINAVLLTNTPYDIHLLKGADAASWYKPALALLKYGAFVTLDDPTILQTYRTPLYPIFEAFMLFIGGGNNISIIIGQIVLLWFTGIIAYKIIERIFPGKGIVALALVIFNPNTLGTSHLIQSDTLYMFMVTTTLCCLILYGSRRNFRLSAIVGLLFGLTCLVRPSGQYLMLLLPVIYIIIGLVQKDKQRLVFHFYHGILSTIVALIIVFPWAQHNANAGWGYNLATAEIEVVYFRDNVIYLESILNDSSLNDAEKKIEEKEQDYILTYADEWQLMSKQNKLLMLSLYYKKQLLTYDYNIILKGFVESWIGFFGAGGAVNLHNILELDGKRSIQLMSSAGERLSRVDAVISTLSELNLTALFISLLSFLYVVTLRIFGLIGLIAMVKNKEYGLSLILTGAVTYFMLISLFVGNSRYRLPIEPVLIVMAVYGFSIVFKKGIHGFK